MAVEFNQKMDEIVAGKELVRAVQIQSVFPPQLFPDFPIM